jgi:hypothetical protein
MEKAVLLSAAIATAIMAALYYGRHLLLLSVSDS